MARAPYYSVGEGWNSDEQDLWNSRAYWRGYEDGAGWEVAGVDIPDLYRKEAQDAYDDGVGDYADDMEAE